MKEILVLSGKGGAGKTSLTAALARLMSCVLVDCDVDAADLHLLLSPRESQEHPFVAGEAPEFALDRCIGCGRCLELCRFAAIRPGIDGKPAGLAPGGCEGCGVCADHCPVPAITMVPQQCGVWYRSETVCGTMLHARLRPGAENSGKLVAVIRKAAQAETRAQGLPFLLADGPPGIGCPVISALTGADLAVLVTEPSVSGIHDMKRTAELARSFDVPVQVVINKSDIDPGKTAEIAEFCRRNGMGLAGKIGFDPLFTAAMRQGRTVMDYPDSAPARAVTSIWEQLHRHLNPLTSETKQEEKES